MNHLQQHIDQALAQFTFPGSDERLAQERLREKLQAKPTNTLDEVMRRISIVNCIKILKP